MNRKEHLNWCKQRALVYLERNEPMNAIASMQSDMSKHAETANHSCISLLSTVDSTSVEAVRRCIKGFN